MQERSMDEGLKMMSSPYCAVAVLNVREPRTMEWKSFLFVMNRLTYLWGAF